MDRTPTDTDGRSVGPRLRERFGSISPFSLAMLGFIGFLGDAFTQLVILQVVHLFWLFALWPVASLLIGVVKQSIGYEGDDPGPRDWLEMDTGWRGLVAVLLGVPLWILNPLMFQQDAVQLLGSLVAIARHRGSPPNPDSHTQSTPYTV